MKTENEKKLVLDISGEITDEMYSYVLEQITHSTFDQIVLLINSTGGNIKHAIAIYELLIYQRKKIITIILGDCMSCATILFAAGEERYISKKIFYMLHQPEISLNEDAKYNILELKYIISDLNEIIKIWKNILKSSSSKLTDSFLKKAFSSAADTCLTAEQILKLGLATDTLDKFDMSILQYNQYLLDDQQ